MTRLTVPRQQLRYDFRSARFSFIIKYQQPVVMIVYVRDTVAATEQCWDQCLTMS